MTDLPRRHQRARGPIAGRHGRLRRRTPLRGPVGPARGAPRRAPEPGPAPEPAGPAIILAAGALYILSLLFGSQDGVARRLLPRAHLQR